ncbi:Charged multivesicular body protein 6, variant 3 [Bonamia ostreae]|uniref:Charged multivesicular body protein 6, variant 3 n=1 Tax=Bonamia ostreae TaxID=126728 RepID=A0ABV2ARU7_9EUKA
MQLKHLLTEIEKKSEIIKKLAKEGKRNIAIAMLKIKKNLEFLLDNRIKNLNNLDMILLEINSLYVNVLTFDGLKVGTEILSNLNSNIDLKKIDENLFNLNNILEESKNVSEVLSEG